MTNSKQLEEFLIEKTKAQSCAFPQGLPVSTIIILTDFARWLDNRELAKFTDDQIHNECVCRRYVVNRYK